MSSLQPRVDFDDVRYIVRRESGLAPRWAIYRWENLIPVYVATYCEYERAVRDCDALNVKYNAEVKIGLRHVGPLSQDRRGRKSGKRYRQKTIKIN